MTTCDDAKVGANTATLPCTCDSCAADLPANPFVALRVAFGMLLGEEEFRVLMGNPRGKQMLHSAWLHGRGVVWGYGVTLSGERVLRVSPGLAIDGIGREVASETTWCTDLRSWIHDEGLTTKVEGCSHRTVHACLVVRFDCCTTDPVPTLADPCDVTRKHDDYSRVVETAQIQLVPKPCPCPGPVRPFHRVRVLLGLDCVGDDDEAGERALRAARRVADAPGEDQVRVLLEEFRELAAYDAVDRRPAREDGDPCPTFFPVTEDESEVVLACVEIDVRDEDGCPDIVDVRWDFCCRSTLLPTETIQELACGLPPGLVGTAGGRDAGGPRVIPETVAWNEDGTDLVFRVTAPLNRGSLRRAVRITSLSERGWVDEDIDTVGLARDRVTVTVRMADRPVNDVVRLIVHGTGPTPVFGIDPVAPLAGIVGGPPGTFDDGHDAVLTFPNPVEDGRTDEDSGNDDDRGTGDDD